VFFGLTVLLMLSLLAALSKVGHTYRSRPSTFLFLLLSLSLLLLLLLLFVVGVVGWILRLHRSHFTI
jgi:hypothetical protein